jgi:hypothetical protein
MRGSLGGLAAIEVQASGFGASAIGGSVSETKIHHGDTELTEVAQERHAGMDALQNFRVEKQVAAGADLRLQRLSASLLINFNVHTLLPGLGRILR